jgi:tRNA threonylcarbamoyladenosine biosynthesis protein TsaE
MKPDTAEMVFWTESEEDTFYLGEKLGRELAGDELVLISGELGSGKTVFVKGLASGLGVKDVSLVCSPSFTLVNVYEGNFPLFHVDLYRLEEPDEITDLGLEDYLGQGVVAVEWAERLPGELLWCRTVRVVIKVEDQDRRKILIRGLEGINSLKAEDDPVLPTRIFEKLNKNPID